MEQSPENKLKASTSPTFSIPIERSLSRACSCSNSTFFPHQLWLATLEWVDDSWLSLNKTLLKDQQFQKHLNKKEAKFPQEPVVHISWISDRLCESSYSFIWLWVSSSTGVHSWVSSMGLSAHTAPVWVPGYKCRALSWCAHCTQIQTQAEKRLWPLVISQTRWCLGTKIHFAVHKSGGVCESVV